MAKDEIGQALDGLAWVRQKFWSGMRWVGMSWVTSENTRYCWIRYHRGPQPPTHPTVARPRCRSKWFTDYLLQPFLWKNVAKLAYFQNNKKIRQVLSTCWLYRHNFWRVRPLYCDRNFRQLELILLWAYSSVMQRIPKIVDKTNAVRLHVKFWSFLVAFW